MTFRLAGLLALTSCLIPEASAYTYTLITEPDQGLAPIYSLISSAKSTLDMTMYELTDTQAEQLLAQAASGGATVRVILDQNLEKSNNAAAYNYLGSHGVQVHWANPKYSATHQKTITVDGATTAIMTLNLTSQYYASSRDFAVIENDPNDIASIEATFDADFADSTITPPGGDDLVWSPTNSESSILRVINTAQHSLRVENEEMGDTDVINALISAATRGVLVQVAMTNTGNDYAAEFSQLAGAGIQVSTYSSSASLYIHAKVILADYGGAGAQAFVGSENFSNASLNKNRELGLILTGALILQSLNATLANDVNGGAPWASSTLAIVNVVNTAGSQSGFAPNAWLTIYGTNLSPLADSWSHSIINGALPTSLDGVTVAVGGQPAYLQYISPTQINAVAPDVEPGTVEVVVTGPNGAASTTTVAHPVQPAFFQWGSYAVATHQDYSYAVRNGTFSSASVPAAPGETIILWGAGFGTTTPLAPAGIEAPSGGIYETVNKVTVTLGNTPATVYSAAVAPGFVALYQVAIQIPGSLVDGDYPIIASIAGVQSPPNILLTVLK